jgi:hypothetical protein
VQFYFRGHINGENITLALVSLYSAPNAELLQESFQTVYLCTYTGVQGLWVVPAKTLMSVVAMIPLDHNEPNVRFLMEKPGLEVAMMANRGEEVQDENDEDDDNNNE